MKIMKFDHHIGKVLLATACVIPTQEVMAQDGSKHGSSIAALLEEVVVKARRKDNAEALQDVPVAISAYSSDQLDAMQMVDLADITASVPNANAEGLGTYPGYVNFNIRGMGTLGSTISDEPTVGVFIDGVYQGVAAGILLDSFDLEAVEILRGPQGTLFGRNVTGGAALVRTSLPTGEFSAKVKLAAENHGATQVSAVVSGPIIDDKLLGKIAIFDKQREDYIDNFNKANPLTPNADDLGEQDQQIYRGALTWRASEDVEVTFRAEHMESDEDSLVQYNMAGIGALVGPENLALMGLPAGKYDDPEETGGDVGGAVPHSELDSASIEVNWSLGKGELTSITAWRDFTQEDMQQDFDNSALQGFEIFDHAIGQEQISQEFIYNVTLSDHVSLTSGLYYFQQDVSNRDWRIAGGSFGGTGRHVASDLNHTVMGIFSSLDIAMSDQWSLSLGGRFTKEKKEVALTRIGAFAGTGGAAGCAADGGSTATSPTGNIRDTINFDSCTADFEDKKEWANFTPKVGLQYLVSDSSQIYGSWSRGFRSGGFSVRADYQTNPAFNEEMVDAYEIGFKHDFDNGARLNGAVFYNEFEDLQRTAFDPVTGSQVTRNAAEAVVQGAELEGMMPIGDHLVLQASLGYTDAELVSFDNNGDGQVDIDGTQMPGVPHWQRDLMAVYELPLFDAMTLTFRAAYHYRGALEVTDDNRGSFGGLVSQARETYDASISLASDEKGWRITAYGKNLTNVTTGGLISDAGFWAVETSYAPRTYGAELIYGF